MLLGLAAPALCEQTSHVSIKHGRGRGFQHQARPSLSLPSNFGTKHNWSKKSKVSQSPTYKPRPHIPHKAPEPTYQPSTEKTTTYEIEPIYDTTESIYVTPNTSPYNPSYSTNTLQYHTTMTPRHYKAPTTKASAYGNPKSQKHTQYESLPQCSYNTTKTWCLEDSDYPMYEIQDAAQRHPEKILALYADVAELGTLNSVDGPPVTLQEETYLCPSDIGYVRPLRAVNVDNKWRIIINGIKVNYNELTQTTRLEECLAYNEPCSLIPPCYVSNCLQKSVYHRFLVYNPYDLYFPFAVESFQLPASCACTIGEFQLP